MWGGSEVSITVSPASEGTLPGLCRRPHLCTVWNCPGRGDSACGSRGRACPPQGWGASYMPESCGTAPGTRHRETMVPMGSRCRPLCQEDRITLGGPGGPACWDWSRCVRAAHLGTWRGWGRSRSGAEPRPPLPPQGTGTLRAEEQDRRRPWSGSLSGPCRAGSRLSTPTTGTSCRAL